MTSARMGVGAGTTGPAGATKRRHFRASRGAAEVRGPTAPIGPPSPMVPWRVRAAYCWGSGTYGQLGDETGLDSSSPVRVQSDSSFTSVTAGAYHTCALSSASAAYCWGSNNHGQLGDGSQTSSLAPVAVGGGIQFQFIHAGLEHTCEICMDAELYCWGDNDWGELGDGTRVDKLDPTRVLDP